MWNKEDRAEQLLIDRKGQTMTSASNVKQNNNLVSKT
jgi:hypothetical protein